MNNKRIKASVCMITYNQEQFITKALDSILMQRVSFKYNIVIGEDCSTDSTREILLNYSNNNPGKFKLLNNKKNLGMIDNWINTLNHCKGKYIAVLEGDDYWADPYKQQKQVDFLEENPDYGMIHTDNSNYYQNTKKFKFSHKQDYYPNPPSGDVFEELLKKNFISTLTVLVRRNVLMKAIEKLYNWINPDLIMDYTLWLEVSRLTKIKYIDEITAVYRISDGTASRPKEKEEIFNWLKNKLYIKNAFISKYHINNKIIKENLIEYCKKLLRYLYRNKLDLKLDENIFNLVKPTRFNDYIYYISYKYALPKFKSVYYLIEFPYWLRKKLSKMMKMFKYF